jgi:hypothetical protein
MKMVDKLKTKAKTFDETQEKVFVVVMMFVATVALVAMARFIVTMMFIETFLNHEEIF